MTPSEHDPYLVQPLVALLFAEGVQTSEVQHLLEQQWGAVAFRSDPIPFQVTDYYEGEMGPNLKRSIWSFEQEINASDLVRWKKEATEIEDHLSENGDRTVNLDPGYLDPAKLVLASWKENGQKIYLSDGVFADMVLLYEKGDWKPLPWTFPDFRDGRYDDALTRIRTEWKRKKNRD